MNDFFYYARLQKRTHRFTWSPGLELVLHSEAFHFHLAWTRRCSYSGRALAGSLDLVHRATGEMQRLAVSESRFGGRAEESQEPTCKAPCSFK